MILALLAGFVFFGGMRRIAATTEKIVPLMAVLYLAGGLWVLLTHLDMLLPAFKMIFVGAFDPSAATGGLIGAGVKEAMRYGVARGLFSNEAGMGSAPNAAAAADVLEVRSLFLKNPDRAEEQAPKPAPPKPQPAPEETWIQQNENWF